MTPLKMLLQLQLHLQLQLQLRQLRNLHQRLHLWLLQRQRLNPSQPRLQSQLQHQPHQRT